MKRSQDARHIPHTMHVIMPKEARVAHLVARREKKKKEKKDAFVCRTGTGRNKMASLFGQREKKRDVAITYFLLWRRQMTRQVEKS